LLGSRLLGFGILSSQLKEQEKVNSGKQVLPAAAKGIAWNQAF
jgi:hypothetical protein